MPSVIKWYSEACDVRTIVHKIFELSILNYDPNVSTIIALIRDIKV